MQLSYFNVLDINPHKPFNSEYSTSRHIEVITTLSAIVISFYLTICYLVKNHLGCSIVRLLLLFFSIPHFLNLLHKQRSLQQSQVMGGQTTVRRAVSGTASSVAFTPLQGLEIVSPQAVEKKVENAKYFSSTAGFLKVKKQ